MQKEARSWRKQRYYPLRNAGALRLRQPVLPGWRLVSCSVEVIHHIFLYAKTHHSSYRCRQLPASSKTIYECWSITYCRPRRGTRSWLKLGNSEPGNVVSAAPQTHFDQEELTTVVDRARNQYQPLTYASRDYDEHLERRLRRLDWVVQDELCGLIRDRTENASNSFRRREYKLVVLVGVPGGEMTDAGSVSRTKTWSEWLSWPGSLLGCGRRSRDHKTSSHVEYRVILRGTEVKRNDTGWGLYSRYAQPWKRADEAALASVKGKCEDSHTLLD